MKKLTNKKGFTLIEMLVVIAIIAVLVAIIIPVVSSATVKAAAATDAANMRSYKAEIVTAYLSGDQDKVVVTSTTTGSTTTYTVNTSGLTEPEMKDVPGLPESPAWSVTYDGSAFTVTYGGFDIADFATVAEDGGELS